MCLILFAWRADARYPLVVAANRDEFYARPTAPMGFWGDAPDVLAGRDLEAGGTWMGISRSGRFAAITNYRDPSRLRSGMPSRGPLVSSFLQGISTPRDYMKDLARRGKEFNGFNLLVGDAEALWYFSNENGPPQPVEPGIHGLSNHLLDTPWPKVEQGRRELAQVLEHNPGPTRHALMAILEDRKFAPDSELPETGVGLARERLLSPKFIEMPEYGTRCSTALLAAADGNVSVAEKTHATGEVCEFQLRWRAWA